MEFDQLIAGNADPLKDSDISAEIFPQFPGEEPLAYDATKFRERAETALASAGLLAVVQGEEPASVRSIIDVDLALLPELPPDDRN